MPNIEFTAIGHPDGKRPEGLLLHGRAELLDSHISHFSTPRSAAQVKGRQSNRQRNPPPFLVAPPSSPNNYERPVSILQSRRIAHEACHRAMEMRQQQFANGALAFQRFLMP